MNALIAALAAYCVLCGLFGVACTVASHRDTGRGAVILAAVTWSGAAAVGVLAAVAVWAVAGTTLTAWGWA